MLTELPAITACLVRRHPEAGLAPAGPLGEARCRECRSWLAGRVHGISRAGRWRPHRFIGEPDRHDAIMRDGRRIIGEPARAIDTKLAAGNGYPVGDRFSVADPYLLAIHR
ncbi:hypothetical protein [Burkholderia plantarii]|uniref:Glutathione S-transferase n=1 Tax=Burkholderia plantarii TaxID=41899 RepID=A0A0B6S040_BURPL|nr:hypothetical protein [Burkholderia plantarii]AJK48998.1 glutathione S-transferase [Burkholderia plantarii]